MAGEWKPEYGVRSNARRREQTRRAYGVIAEGSVVFNGVEIPTKTILIAGEPVELLSSAHVASSLGFGRTRITDWERTRVIPPTIRIARTRYLTKKQVPLLMKIAELNVKGPTLAEIARRDESSREVWRRWWE